MSTFLQLLRRQPRKKQVRKGKALKLEQNPQKKGICLKILTVSPKKPNSANRRVAKIFLVQSGRKITLKIPGEGHNLQQHSTVLVRGGRVHDLIGVKYIGVRGKFDLLGVKGRKTSRSLYGVKRN